MTIERARDTTPCDNLNHRRSDAPVGHCPQCGRVVNSRFHVATCSEDRHATARRQGSVYCVNCGLRLRGSF